MNKIDFKNLPDTSTPLSAENLNQLQTNVETAIDGKISNTSGTSQTIGYSQEYVNNALLDVYSTTETRIGTWIDGKPLYRKVINAGTITTTNTQIGSITNPKYIVSIRGTAHSTALSNQTYNIPNVHENMASYYINVLINNGNEVRLRFGSGISQLENVYVVLEYTKTTD